MIALGGNALSPREEAGTIYQQFSHTRESLDAIMHFVNLEYNICITHGNGPQVGDALRAVGQRADTDPPARMARVLLHNSNKYLVTVKITKHGEHFLHYEQPMLLNRYIF